MILINIQLLVTNLPTLYIYIYIYIYTPSPVNDPPVNDVSSKKNSHNKHDNEHCITRIFLVIFYADNDLFTEQFIR